jgi:flagellar biosynthesis chaperone FliJ
MKSLKTLMRIQQRELDRLRKELTAEENKKGHLIAMIEKLQGDLLREIDTAQELGEMRGFFGDYSDSIKKKQKQLAANVVQVEQKIQEMMIEIRNRYADLKKYEIAYDRYLLEQAKKQVKKEQQELDEAGLRKFLYGS